MAAPRLLEATNVGSGSYTANWADAPKAQNYLLRNYDVTRIAADAVETARFNTSGVRVDKDYKGLVIITMSDGSVRKEIVK